MRSVWQVVETFFTALWAIILVALAAAASLLPLAARAALVWYAFFR